MFAKMDIEFVKISAVTWKIFKILIAILIVLELRSTINISFQKNKENVINAMHFP